MSTRKRGVRFRARDLERGRRYMWRDEYVPALLKSLDVHPGQTIVDVGCGTGFLSRLIAHRLNGDVRVIGVDKNERLIEVGRKLAKREGLGGIICLRRGTAESIPLDDCSGDRVVCQTLLWILKDPQPSLREMVRVCKPGGLIGAVEGAFDYVIQYAPDDRRLTDLQQKWVVAFARGQRKLYGTDRGIGYKLPSMFNEVGLKRIRLDGFPYVWLESDDRVPQKFKLEEHRLSVQYHEDPSLKEHRENRRILRIGGMSSKEISELKELSYNRSKRILRNPSSISKDFSMNAGLFLLTTGVKN